jgi:hypothetical protein
VDPSNENISISTDSSSPDVVDSLLNLLLKIRNILCITLPVIVVTDNDESEDRSGDTFAWTDSTFELSRRRLRMLPDEGGALVVCGAKELKSRNS